MRRSGSRWPTPPQRATRQDARGRPASAGPGSFQLMNAITNPKDRPVKISCRNVWKIYGERPATFFAERNGKVPDPAATLKAARDSKHIAAAADVSFDVHAGEIFVIMGLSGSGKSTVVRCLSRLVEPTAGEIMLDGKDLLRAVGAGTDRAAPPQDGHGVPEFRPAAAPQRARQRRLSAARAGPGARAAAKRARGDDRAGRARQAAKPASRASFPAASSSASASPAAWRWSRRSGSSTSRSARSIR